VPIHYTLVVILCSLLSIIYIWSWTMKQNLLLSIVKFNWGVFKDYFDAYMYLFWESLSCIFMSSSTVDFFYSAFAKSGVFFLFIVGWCLNLMPHFEKHMFCNGRPVGNLHLFIRCLPSATNPDNILKWSAVTRSDHPWWLFQLILSWMDCAHVKW
jgi:hypothetical protein